MSTVRAEKGGKKPMKPQMKKRHSERTRKRFIRTTTNISRKEHYSKRKEKV